MYLGLPLAGDNVGSLYYVHKGKLPWWFLNLIDQKFFEMFYEFYFLQRNLLFHVPTESNPADPVSRLSFNAGSEFDKTKLPSI